MPDNDNLADAKAQGQAQFDSIKEMVAELQDALDSGDDRGADECRERIQEDALSVEVRSGWYDPCRRNADTRPAEFNILLCTGGPAVRITGTLDQYGQPETAWLEVQDWFTPWTKCAVVVAPDDYDSEPILLVYAQCFYFGD